MPARLRDSRGRTGASEATRRPGAENAETVLAGIVCGSRPAAGPKPAPIPPPHSLRECTGRTACPPATDHSPGECMGERAGSARANPQRTRRERTGERRGRTRRERAGSARANAPRTHGRTRGERAGRTRRERTGEPTVERAGTRREPRANASRAHARTPLARNGAGRRGRGRTDTPLTGHRLLRPARLPFRHSPRCRAPPCWRPGRPGHPARGTCRVHLQRASRRHRRRPDRGPV